MDGEDVVGVPQHVGPIALDDLLDLVHHVLRRATAMGVAEDGVAAPGARVRAAAGRDQRHRALPWCSRQVSHVARRRSIASRSGNGWPSRSAIVLARRGAHDVAVRVAERDAADRAQVARTVLHKPAAPAPRASARLRRWRSRRRRCSRYSSSMVGRVRARRGRRMRQRPWPARDQRSTFTRVIRLA